MKKIKDMTQEEIEDEVCDRLFRIYDEKEFLLGVLAMVTEYKEGTTMMLMYMRDKGNDITRSEAVNAARNIYHYLDDIYRNLDD